MLSVESLDHYYGDSRTLWSVDAEVSTGQVTCLMGRNGVGKTTLLKCVMGLERLAAGSLRYEGENLARLPAESRAALGIGYVPQGRGIFPRLTVEENLRVAVSTRPREKRRIPALVHELFPVLADMRRRRGGDLSGGQQQQLAIGRALALEPRLLILDEPTEGIQPNIVHEIGDIVLRLNAELGLTVLLVEQKLAFVRRIADRFVLLEKGRVVAGGDIAALDEATVQRHLTV